MGKMMKERETLAIKEKGVNKNGAIEAEMAEMLKAFGLVESIKNSGGCDLKMAKKLLETLSEGPLKEALSNHLRSSGSQGVGRKE